MKSHTRWQVTEAPAQQPGVDWLTRTQVGPFIDTGVDVKRFGEAGRIYLAADTVREMAEILGYFAPDPDAERKLDEAVQAAYRRGVQDGLTNRQELYNALRFVADGLGLLDDSAGGDGNDVDTVDQAPEGDDEAASEGAEGESSAAASAEGGGEPESGRKPGKAGGSKRKARASAPEQRPDDISDAVGNDGSERRFEI